MRARALVTLLAVSTLAGGEAWAAVDPHYAGLLLSGRAAYERKAYPVAVRDLRIACFGLLEEPKALADCLVRLALAQDRANDPDGFQATFELLAVAEERFRAYSQGDLAPELRAAFEPRLAARVPAATLEATPAFRALVARKTGKDGEKSAARPGKSPDPKPDPVAAKAPPPAPAAPTSPTPPSGTRSSAGALPPNPGPARSPGGTVPIAASPSSPSGAAGPPRGGAVTAPPIAAPPSGQPGPRPLTEAERQRLQQTREVLSAERSSRELRQAFDAVKEIADAHPNAPEPQHLVGAAAYRLSRWADAVTYFKRGGDPGDDEPELLFYLAVSLFETGDKAGAASVMKRALPNLRRTPYVDTYTKKILGS
jgi:hypothetical protein